LFRAFRRAIQLKKFYEICEQHFALFAGKEPRYGYSSRLAAVPRVRRHDSVEASVQDHHNDGYMFFFKCLSCAIEYPRAVDGDKIDFATLAGIRIPGVSEP
jgi:hypothetical protein